MISGSQILITQQNVFEMLDVFGIKRTSYKLSFCNGSVTICFVGQRLKTWINRKKIKAVIEEKRCVTTEYKILAAWEL